MTICLSKKHGVNPSLMQCFYCLEDFGVAIVGRLPGDAEAPRRTCFDREPCDKCKGFMEQGIILISVSEDKTTDKNNPYRTGGWCVVKECVITTNVRPAELCDGILKARMAFVPDDAWGKLGLPRG